MKKIILCSVSLFMTAITLNAQTFEWAISAGGSANDEGRSITTDAIGNTYVTGFYRETADFDPSGTTMNLTSNGDRDIFVQKIDPNGALIWAKSMGMVVGLSLSNEKDKKICGRFESIA